MDIYARKKRWKWILFLSALVIVSISLLYTNTLVKKIAKDERNKVKIWAEAIQRKANLVNYTDVFFEKIRKEERKKGELWAEAYKKLMNPDPEKDYSLYLDIISENSNIPVIITDDKYNILNSRNTDFSKDTVKVLKGELLKEFSQFEPIKHSEYNITIYLFYKESKLYTELRLVLNDLTNSFFSEVVDNSLSVPVIVVDSNKQKIIASGNINKNLKETIALQNELHAMSLENQPIEVEVAGRGKNFIYYENSFLLTQLKYYPYIQFIIIGLFLLVSYFLFSISRRSEQNQVWLGMSKETAHQLGTPLSSLIAWVEMLKLNGIDRLMTDEIEKDIDRLETITKRFSKIGSEPELTNENIVEVTKKGISYLITRSPKKVKYIINIPENKEIIIPLNQHLFDWVIENLCRNAIDAMGGEGEIKIEMFEDDKFVYIDVSDTGKGISKSNFKTVFHPGYTSKKRGWGLGLSLSKRIIKEYHSGKIFVKSSVINKGTCFRIMLKNKI
ncbi:MAG: HAMP domain-containing histidine kinase [Bacteroidetes bacterium]|nr:HAMP domain-containing histidine kinase [Bacteroidota bacterium]